MEAGTDRFDALLRSGASRLKGHQRRLFMAEVATELCEANSRRAEQRFGWGRETVEKGLHEARGGIQCLENFTAQSATQRREESITGSNT